VPVLIDSRHFSSDHSSIILLWYIGSSRLHMVQDLDVSYRCVCPICSFSSFSSFILCHFFRSIAALFPQYVGHPSQDMTSLGLFVRLTLSISRSSPLSIVPSDRCQSSRSDTASSRPVAVSFPYGLWLLRYLNEWLLGASMPKLPFYPNLSSLALGTYCHIVRAVRIGEGLSLSAIWVRVAISPYA
jgi:hypothetical protein